MLILLRHGQTVANATGRLQGRIDNPLDATGHEQASAVAALIGPVDRVVSSPLVRARETAGYVERRHGVEGSGVEDSGVEVDERLLELDYGELDGRRLGDVSAATWERWRTDADFALPGGESLTALRLRVWDLLEELRGDIEHHDIVLVSHVSPIKAAVTWALGVGDEVSWRLSLSTASVTRVVLRGGRPLLLSFNEVSTR